MRESWGVSRIYGMRDWSRIVGMRHLFIYIKPPTETIFTDRDEMVIIRDIVNDFSDDEDIELCCDDDEDLELDSSELANITYGIPSSFFVTIDSDAGQDIQNRKNNLSNDFDNELFIGMQFESKDATINAIKQFHIKNSVDYIVVESRPDRYVGQCKYFGSGCQWRIRASLNGKRDLWEIRKINGTHTCVSTNISQDHTKLNSSFIANCIIHLVSEDPGIPVKALVKEIVTRFGYTVTYRKAWTAKQIAMSQIYGDWEGSYKELPRWFNTVQCYAAGTILAECVNGVLKGSRALPITSLVQATYHRLNSWFLHHRNEATSMIMAGHIYCEELTKVLNENNRKATCQTIRTFSRESGVFVVEVPGREGSRHSKVYTVRLNQYWCECGEFQSLRLPCSHCNEMIDAFAKLLPTAFSDSNYQAPLTMPVAPEFQQLFESQTQTDTHPQAFTQQTPVPQQPFQFQSFGALSDYSISHQFGSSSHYVESLPTMFGTTSTTPLSVFNSEQYYQPTMPTQVDDEDDEEEEEEVPQLVRGGTRQPTQPSLRVQPPRRKRPPPCGISSHRRH
ncbi:hypothetical protein Lal_00004093 [Lupinus albus]|nr:hypothetical protein Lal_00004093 [Lupinus albus]